MSNSMDLDSLLDGYDPSIENEGMFVDEIISSYGESDNAASLILGLGVSKNEFVSIIENLNKLIEEYGIAKVLDAIRPIYDIYKFKHLFLPNPKDISTIVKAFEILSQKYMFVMKNIFKIVKILPQTSANGKIFILSVDSSNSLSKFLVKIPLKRTADPLSYEYYVGVTLNRLRESNVNHFSLVYGRFGCGVNTELTIRDKFCDKNYASKTHVIYEYITDKSGNVCTLESYMDENIEKNPFKTQTDVMTILFILMITLQKGQDALSFTHYDLHANNILVVKLGKIYALQYVYNNKTYTVYTDVIPYIIDYGRSHIDPKSIDTKIRDTETNREYEKFSEYQREIWSKKVFRVDQRGLKDVQEYVDGLLGDDKSKRYITRKTGLKGVKRDDLIEIYYKDGDNITWGITPHAFNKSYDHYRIVRSIASIMLSYKTYGLNISDIWSDIDSELQQAFPFFIPDFFVLPTSYDSLSGKYNKPSDVAGYIYTKFIRPQAKLFQDSVKVDVLSWEQIGGNNKIEKISKSVYKTMGDLGEKFYKTILDKINKLLKKSDSDDSFNEILAKINRSNVKNYTPTYTIVDRDQSQDTSSEF